MTQQGISNPAFEGVQAEHEKDAKKSSPAPVSTIDDAGWESFAIIKNVCIISLAFMFLFTSYNSMSNLQSSLNKGKGTASLTVLYAFFILSCCLIPSWLIRRLKERYTMAVCMLCYSAYIAAQFYPETYTLVPTAIIVGLSAAPLWSAKCTYLTKVGKRLAEIQGVPSEVPISRFFGIFFAVFQTTQVWGNIISSTVLSIGVESENKTEEQLLQCGYNFCLEEEASADNGDNTSQTNASDKGPPLWQIYTMSSIYLVCSLTAASIVALFVDPLSRFNIKSSSAEEKSDKELTIATFNHLRHPYQLLIVPLTIWSGLEQGFLGADYTAAYVSCGIGVHMVGYIIICYGVCDALCSIAFSSLVRKFGRVPFFSLGFLINISLNICLTWWTPRPDDLIIFFVIAGLWGVADAIWQTQINTFYGVIFPGDSEAAFSNYRLWESTGFIISYACSTSACIDTKLTILNVFLIVGILGYYVVEVIEKRGGLPKNDKGKVVLLGQQFPRGSPQENNVA